MDLETVERERQENAVAPATYRAPRLRVYGTLQELTAAGTKGTAENEVMGMFVGGPSMRP